ncbi:MAG: type VI secretion system baseplate subunit TssK [Holosporales bacterium]|jgi:type VI secretion system protein ImpJ|nr:type VI secretion system baseplate subunit TssK [Holosporales bacterium]
MTQTSKKIYQIPLDINWHEGMLLSQHHFQQNDMRNFRVLATQIRLLSSNHYGIRHMRMDTVALTDGYLKITELEAVFQDGLILSFFPEKHENLKPLNLNLNTAMPAGINEVTVYLTIAESSDDVSPVLGNPARFYSIDGNIVRDENIKENEIRVPRLFPNAFLHAGDTVPDFCIGFPLCVIIKSDGVCHIKNRTPPCFFIERHFPLWKRCESLAISIREKVVFLVEKLQNLADDSVHHETSEILAQISSIMPGFEALIYSNEIRPYELYQELATVLGAVSVLIPTDIIPIMRSYDHCDIDRCMYPVIDLIEHYISTVERGFTLLPFNKKERFFYRYVSDNDLAKVFDGKLYVGVRVDKACNVSEVEAWMRDAVIVSDFAIEDVRTKRTKGASRAVIRREIIARILPGVGVTVFEVDTDGEFIKGEQNLHVFNPGNTSSVHPNEITLYLPKGRTNAR